MPTNINYSKALAVLHTAMLAGQIIFAVLAFGLVYSGSLHNNSPGLENIFFIMVPALIITGRLIGTAHYKKKLQEALNNQSIEQRLNLYRSAFIIRCALLEGPVIFAIIAYLLTNRIEIMLFAVGGILLFMILKPTKDKIAGELQVPADSIS